MTPRRGSGGVARPLRRLARDRGRMAALVLVAVTAVAASGVQSGAAAALQRTLDENWRGAYDILVTARPLQAGSGSLLAPNSLGDGVHGMTLAQLARVREVPGVEVAAPIGDVLTAGATSAVAAVTLPTSSADAQAARTSPQAYRLTATVTTDDGLGSRVVTTESAQNVVDLRPGRPGVPASDLSGSPVSFGDVAVDCDAYPLLCIDPARPAPEVTILSGDGGSSTDVASDGVLSLGFASGLLQTSTRITLIDPVAERKLLGSRGSFLAPLQEFPTRKVADAATMTTWARNSGGSGFGTCFLSQNRISPDEAQDSPEYRAQLQAFLAANPRAATVREAAYVPVLIAGTPTAQLRVSIDVSRLGAATELPAEAGYAVPDSATATEVGSIEGDLSPKLNPFLGATRTLPFPGTPEQPLDADVCPQAHSLSLSRVGVLGPGGSASAEGSTGSATLAPTGYLDPAAPVDLTGDVFSASADGTEVGAEAVYQPVRPLRADSRSDGVTAVPVGSFSTAALAAYAKTLDYVPLGAYQPVGARTTVDGRRVALRPSVSGRGVIASQTVALASIYDAPAWNQTAPVSAIRVRVAGIGGYSPAAVRRVVAVAQSIEATGVHATVVAGSSPAPVAVKVDGYAFGTTDPSGTQRIGALGGIRQSWSELGAAARAQVSLSGATLAVLAIGLGSVVILLGAVQFSSLARRRRQTAVLHDIGWTRGSIRRWMIAEEVPALAVVALVAAGSAWLAGFSTPSVVAGAVSLAAITITSSLAVVLGAARPPARRTLLRSSRRATARTPRLFGVRQARIHPAVSAVLVVATVVVAMSAAAIALSITAGAAAAGASLLARFSSGEALIPQLALGLSGLLAGVALAVIARRADLRARSAQWDALRAMGWTGRDLTSAQRAESVTIVVPAILVSAALTVVLVVAVRSDAAPIVVTSAVLAAMLVSAGVLFLGRTLRS